MLQILVWSTFSVPLTTGRVVLGTRLKLVRMLRRTGSSGFLCLVRCVTTVPR